MSGNITFNPYATTQPLNSFLSQTQGYVQGAMMDDPSVRMEITAGYLLGTQALPLWGGVAIQELVNIPTGAGSGADGLGSAVLRSVSPATISGWSINNQNNSMIITPGATVPLSGSNTDVHYIRTNTNARIAVACAPSLLGSLTGSSTNTQVSWDFTNQQLVPFVTAYPANVITASSWTSGAVSFTTTSAHGVTVGSYFTITGAVPVAYNGDYIAVTGTTGSTLVAALATNPGTSTTQGTLVAGGGAAPCKVLSINTNSKIVSPYVAGSPLLWTTGTAAIILI